jgi:DNA polymerase-3 subunit delta'
MIFRDIIGHRRLTTLIARAIERESLPPTLLFAGPSGVGKWAVARATAQAVNCLEPVKSDGDLALDACGTCRSCDRIARGVHVDVVMLQPDDRASIKIDLVRDTLSQVGYRPFEGRKRVVLIRDADTLEQAAQNAFLKSLEEPPPGTMFILTTSVPGALLPTVRSRCMRLRFGRMTAGEVAAALVRDHDYNDTDARAAAPLADGSLGQALSLVDSDLTMFRELAMGLLRTSAGRADAQSRTQAASPLHTQPGSAKKERTRADVAIVLRLMASMLRDLEAINAGADRSVLANPLLSGDLEALARAYSGDRARAAFGAVDRALTALERNAGIKVVTEWLAVQM